MTVCDVALQREKRSYKRRKHRYPAVGSVQGLRGESTHPSYTSRFRVVTTYAFAVHVRALLANQRPPHLRRPIPRQYHTATGADLGIYIYEGSYITIVFLVFAGGHDSVVITLIRACRTAPVEVVFTTRDGNHIKQNRLYTQSLSVASLSFSIFYL